MNLKSGGGQYFINLTMWNKLGISTNTFLSICHIFFSKIYRINVMNSFMNFIYRDIGIISECQRVSKQGILGTGNNL